MRTHHTHTHTHTHTLSCYSHPNLCALINLFSSTATLEAPAIIIYPNSAIVTNGYSVVVACVVDGTPSPNITWSMTAQNGSVATLQMSTTISIRQNTTTYGNDIYTVSYLTYCSFWANNSGNYTCSGSNGVNGTSLTVTSAGFVLGKPSQILCNQRLFMGMACMNNTCTGLQF